MAKRVAQTANPVLRTMRRSRASLLCTTALQAAACIVLALPAVAQPAVSARPQGGQVVAGNATIARTATATNIAQSTNRAAIDWRSFDIGSGQSVNFAQPSAAAVTLNRVTGPDPSAIAGQIRANGQIIITNPSGVVFHAGAQINAQSIVVSAPGITNQNFMAGRMVFDQASKPDARIENRGTITVKQAGLAALVAPSVSNSGVINARLGQVVLAGAQAHTLDMYGDGLVSIDVTRQVRQAPRGTDGKAVTALVTNTGSILADGGVVQLTAAAADGVVQTLVRAGGHIQANSVGSRTGRIEVTGTGGSVVVEGRLMADGAAPGGAGGEIVAMADGTTALAGGAHVTASGQAGGGTVAIGTTLAHARGPGTAPAGTSARVAIATGARVSADATAKGNGGRVTALSKQDTRIGGVLTARGGPGGGDGGLVEMSGERGFTLTGTADASAPKGQLGTILLDPFNLAIVPDGGADTVVLVDPGNPNLAFGTGGGPNTTDTVTRSTVERLNGAVRLQALNDLTVQTSLTLNGEGQSLTLEAGNNLTVNAGSTLTTNGILTLNAASPVIPGFNPAGALTILGNLATSGFGNINLAAGTGGIALVGTFNGGFLNIDTPGPLVQTGGGITVTSLNGTSSSVSLTSRTNAIGSVGRFSNRFAQYTVTGAAGDFKLVDSAALLVLGNGPSPGGGISVQNGRTVSLTVDGLQVSNRSRAGLATVSAPNGTFAVNQFTPGNGVEITSSTKTPDRLSLTLNELSNTNAATLELVSQSPTPATPPAGTITLGKPGEAIDLAGNGGYGALALSASGAVTQGGALTVAKLSGQAGALSFGVQDNVVNELAGFTTAGKLALHTGGGLLVSAPVAAGGGTADVALSTAGGCCRNITLKADVLGATVSLETTNGQGSLPGGINQNAGVITAATLTLKAGSATLNDPNRVAALGSATTDGGLSLTNALPLTVNDIVTNLAGTVTLNAPSVVQTAGSSIITPVLSGAATTASFTSASNQIGAIGNFQSPGGSFALTDAVPLSVGTINAANGRVALVANQIDAAARFGVPGGGSSISAPNGSVTLSPLTAGRRIELIGQVRVLAADVGPPSLSLSQAFLNAVDTTTLVIGGPGVTSAINIGNDGDAINLRNHAATLQLQTTGVVTEGNTGIATLSVGDLVGSAGATTLTGANAIDTLGSGNAVPGTLTGFASTGALAITAAAGLTTNAAISGTTVALTASAGDLVQATGSLTAADTMTLTASGAVAQTGGALAAATLTGVAASLSLPNATLANLGPYTTTGAFQFTNANALNVVGAVRTGDANLALRTGGLALKAGFRGGAVALAMPGALEQFAGGSLQATTLTGRASSVNLGSGSRIGTLSDFISSGGFALVQGGPTDPTPLIVAGTISDKTRISLDNSGPVTLAGTLAAPAIALRARDAFAASDSTSAGTQIATGSITQTAGRLVTDSLSGGADGFGSDGPTSLTAAGNLIGNVGFSSKGGFSLANGRSLSVAGLSDDTRIALTVAGDLALAGTLKSAALVIDASGTITQPSGSLKVGSLSGSAGSASFDQAGNKIDTLGAFASAGDLSLTDSGTLTIGGAVSAGTGRTMTLAVKALGSIPGGSLTAPGGTVRIAKPSLDELTVLGGIGTSLPVTAATLVLGTPTGGPVTIAGALNLSNVSVLDLESGGAVTETGAGAIRVGTLTGNAASATLDGPNRITTLGAFATKGAFSLANLQTLTVGGPLAASVATLGVTGDIVLAGNVVAPTQLTLAADGAVTQTGGSIATGLLTGRADSLTLPNRANAVSALGPFTTKGDFTLVDGTSLTVAGPVDPGNVTIDVAGDLALNSSVTGTTVRLVATGAITEGANGLVDAATLTGSATTASLTGANRVAELGTFSASQGLVLNDTQNLAVTGPVNAGTLGLTAPNVAFAGTIGVGTLDVSATGGVQQTGGTLTAGTFTGSAGSGVSVGINGQAIVGQLGAFSVGNGAIALVDAGPLTITGPLQAASIGIAATGRMTLAGGSLTTDGLPLARQRAAGPTQPGSFLQVLPDAAGAGRFVQSGTTSVLPLAGTTATLRIDLPAVGGTLSLNNLVAPTTDLILSLGSGSAAGNLRASNLLVLGRGGRANLTGTVAGQNTFSAAQASRIDPRFDTLYLLNNCAIQSFTCTIQPTFLSPQSFLSPDSLLRPDILALDVLSLSVTRDRDDPTFLLPNISDRDY